MRSARDGGALLVLVVAGLLGGCASPALMIASQAVDGVSYLTTGKSGTDHLLSAALEEDCALHRVISGVAVCQAEPADVARTEPEQTPDIQTASLADTPFVGDDALDGDSISMSDSRVAAAKPAARQAGKASNMGLGADMFFVPHPASSDSVTSGQESAAPGERAPLPDAAATDELAAVHPVPRFFIVLGSFSDRENAARAARAAGAQVAEAAVSGRSLYRVVAGPFDRHGVAAARRDYARAGHVGAWPVPACVDAETKGCVAID